MVKLIKYLALCWLFLLVAPELSAQLDEFEDVDAMTEKGFFKSYFKGFFKDFTDFGEPFTMNGGVGMNLRSYSANGAENRQDPFMYTFNANLNVRLYTLSLPFSMVITAKNRTSSYPSFSELGDAFKEDLTNRVRSQKEKFNFVRFGMSPHYKWAKLHLGHRTMDFSKFTLANLNFYGIGAELTPGNVRFSVMRGRLAQAEPINLSLVEPNLPIYGRRGWGIKTGYGGDDQSVDLIVFKAFDDENSIDIPFDYANQISAVENLALGLNFQKLFAKRLRLRAVLGYSLFSPNGADALSENGSFLDFLIKERNTTEKKTAIDASLDYEGKTFITGLQFKRIDPNYRSLGAYFFNNDLINILGNIGFQLFEDAMNIRLSTGVQSNNLELTKPTTTTRLSLAGDVAYSKEAFSAGINYSNNSTDVGYVLSQNLDSLNAVIITQNAGLNLSYTLADTVGAQQVIAFTANVQEVNDDILNPVESASSQMIVANLSYTIAFPASGWNVTSRVNYNQNELAAMLIKRYGFGGGVSKKLLDNKMNIGIDFNYFLNSNDNAANSTNLNSQFRFSYSISERLNSSMSWNLLSTTVTDINDFSELTGNFGLQYSF